jgi:hypothetical protein
LFLAVECDGRVNDFLDRVFRVLTPKLDGERHERTRLIERDRHPIGKRSRSAFLILLEDRSLGSREHADDFVLDLLRIGIKIVPQDFKGDIFILA